MDEASFLLTAIVVSAVILVTLFLFYLVFSNNGRRRFTICPWKMFRCTPLYRCLQRCMRGECYGSAPPPNNTSANVSFFECNYSSLPVSS